MVNVPLSQLTVAEIARELDLAIAQQQYLDLLLAKAQGIPVYFH
jgi:hypothetical protein